MKQYLGILGAMVLGAVIMFWVTQSEAIEDSLPERFLCSEDDRVLFGELGSFKVLWIRHCQAGTIQCGVMVAKKDEYSISCVNSGGLFK